MNELLFLELNVKNGDARGFTFFDAILSSQHSSVGRSLIFVNFHLNSTENTTVGSRLGKSVTCLGNTKDNFAFTDLWIGYTWASSF